MEENTTSVFKSFLRSQLRQLKALKEAIKSNDLETAEKLIDEIISDVQSGIED